jgi:hypothetical protein
MYRYPADTDTVIRHFVKQYDTGMRLLFLKNIKNTMQQSNAQPIRHPKQPNTKFGLAQQE